MKEKTKLVWKRRMAGHGSNFDLILVNHNALDRGRMLELLEAIMKESHRGLSLNYDGYNGLKAFFNDPHRPLKASAYALLSNWFLTSSGDKSSMVATRCEALWDEMFVVRPFVRLTSPASGQNHKVLAAEFPSFWSRLTEADGTDEAEVLNVARPTSPTPVLNNSSANQVSLHTPPSAENVIAVEADLLSAVITRGGEHIEIKGTPQAVATFLDQ